MIEKAIVEEIIDNYNIRVRVPRYNLSSSSPHATPFSELPIAGICTLPGCNPVFRIGDIVIISYEGDEIDKPIIIGQLYAQNLLNNQIDINCSSLIVDVNTSLPEETNMCLIFNCLFKIQIVYTIMLLVCFVLKVFFSFWNYDFECIIFIFPNFCVS